MARSLGGPLAMTDITTTDFDVVDDASSFFAPVSSDLIDGLIGQYQHMRAKVERVAEVMNGPDLAGALHFFAEYAGKQDRHLSSSTVNDMFNLKGAIAHLNAAYWSKAMQMTDVLDVMPQKRRSEWHAQITNPLGKKNDRSSHDLRDGQAKDPGWEIEPIPEFTDENVRSTLQSLLAQRERFFAERVDGLFRALSRTHITNAPEGFGKRMIIARAINEWGSVEHGVAGVINDLRCIIAKFMGRDEPKWDATSGVVRFARQRRGEWIALDGGAIRIRVYAVGTAHLEVHPDMAWRLNCILAQLYPAAIPSQFRERPKKRAKEHKLMGRPLPFAVVARLGTLEPARDINPGRNWNSNTWIKVPGCWDFKASSNSAQVQAEADRIMESIGGTKVKELRWAFDYDPTDVVQEIIASGCLPDQKAHQFYPTPERLARIAVGVADIQDDHICLEPSAGMGGLADLMPMKNTVCVEVSPLHCKVLEAKGFAVSQCDFLQWNGGSFHRVVMNPPFSEGRWQAHLQHAGTMVKPGGKLVAILPASAKGKSELLPGFECAWSPPYENEFPGTSVSVVILQAVRQF
jgi:Domain of unknown function (DUF4942)